MPQRERELIAILAETRRQVTADRSTNNVRLAMQVRVIDFLKQDQDVKNWVGVIKDMGVAPTGERWISVEISPNVTISTCHDRACDPTGLTLIRRPLPLYDTVGHMIVGQPLVFSAHIFGGRLGGDSTMVETPDMIAHFDSIQPVD